VIDKWKWYYQNGNIKEEGIFVEGEREGVWKLYNEDVSLKSSLYFNKGNIVSSFNSKAPVAS
jgi:antitoxin component YwqK of YwqJK toxin-antitoxin module